MPVCHRFFRWLAVCLIGAAAPAVAALDAAAVETFLDGYLPGEMAARHIPGLAITVVDGGTPIVTKGYGVMDVTTQRAVDAQTTLFDVQSVAKLFVSMAVLIATEHGLVRLDRDINPYLKDFKIPDTYAAPITLASLLTHTSGLEDRGIGISAPTPKQVQPLGPYLARSLTARVAPPFTNLLYSDQGMTLAAYTVQSATGVPFDVYARDTIFAPLGMDHTFYREVPSAWREHRASAYSFEHGQLARIPHEYYNIWPASSLWTTAVDMSRFIAAQLRGGELDGVRIASAATIQRQHTKQFSYDPQMPGVCFDFFERFRAGRRLLTHSGGGSGFVSELALLPAERIGYFFTYNGYDGSLIDALSDAFLARFFPVARPPAVATIQLEVNQLAPYAGWYWSTRYDHRTIGKLTSLVDGYVEVTPSQDGLLVGDRSYAPVTPTLFVNQDGDTPEYVAFRHDDRGRVTVLLSAAAEAPYQRVSWLYSQPVQFAIVAAALLTYAVVLGCLATAIVRRGWRELFGNFSRPFFGVLAAGNLLCLVALLVQLAESSTPSGAVAFEFGIGAGLRALFGTMSLIAALNLASPVVLAFAWSSEPRQRPWLLLATLTSAITIAYVWFLYEWRIIGFIS